MGDHVFKTYGENIIVIRVPCFDGYVPSAAQWKRREKMRAATAYAQAVYADPTARAVYVAAAKQLGRQPFRLAVSDFLRDRPRIAVEYGLSRPLPKTCRSEGTARPVARIQGTTSTGAGVHDTHPDPGPVVLSEGVTACHDHVWTKTIYRHGLTASIYDSVVKLAE